jgi:hypothetical protein
MSAFIKRSLALNFCQSLNMALGAVLVPLVIGLAKYGEFAVLFAVPASAAVFLHSYFISIAKEWGSLLFRRRSCKLIALATTALFATVVILNNVISATMTALIFVLLAERLRQEVLALCFSSNVIAVLGRLKIIEVRQLILSSAILIIFTLQKSVDGIWLPIFLIASSLVAAISVFNSLPDSPPAMDPSNDAEGRRSKFSPIFARVHEELFITQMPLVIAKLEGSFVLAGVFRLAISGTKIFAKLYPYRFDLVIAAKGTSAINRKQLRLVTAVLIIVPPLVAVVLAFASNKSLHAIGGYSLIFSPWFLGVFAVSGILAFIAAFLPYFASKSWYWQLGVIALFVTMVLMGAIFGPEALLASYLLSQVIICFSLWTGVFHEAREFW